MKYAKLITCSILIGILCGCTFEIGGGDKKEIELYTIPYSNSGSINNAGFDVREGSYLISESNGGGILPGKYYSVDDTKGTRTTIKGAKNQMTRPGINEFSKYETTIYNMNTHEMIEVININKIFEEYLGDSKEKYQLMSQSTMGLTVKDGYDCVVVLVSAVPTKEELTLDEAYGKVIENYPMYIGIQNDYIYWDKEEAMRFPKATSVYKKELGYLQVTNIMAINGWDEQIGTLYYGCNPYWQGTEYENVANISISSSYLREKGSDLLLYEKFPELKNWIFNLNLKGQITLYIDTTNWEKLMLLFFPPGHEINYQGLSLSGYYAKSGEEESISNVEMMLDRMRWVDDFFEEDSK